MIKADCTKCPGKKKCTLEKRGLVVCPHIYRLEVKNRRKEYTKKWKKRNKEKIKTYSKKYYEKHKENNQEKSKTYYDTHLQQCIDRSTTSKKLFY